MRLINVNTFEMEFFSKTYPSYAILSHRWADDEVQLSQYNGVKSRVQHQITSDLQGNRTAGVAKIAGACSLAERESLQYIWIDTCCINKESTSEGSESIRFMFGWYKRAKVCFVRLPDVDWRTKSHAQIRDSIWFKRGWILQELPTPRNVVFYD